MPMLMMFMITMMMLVQVGPGDGYMLKLGGFNKSLSSLGDSMITKIKGLNLNGMKFTTK